MGVPKVARRNVQDGGELRVVRNFSADGTLSRNGWASVLGWILRGLRALRSAQSRMKLSKKQARFLREGIPFMVFGAVGGFVYFLIKFDNLGLAAVGLILGVVCAISVHWFHYGPKK